MAAAEAAAGMAATLSAGDAMSLHGIFVQQRAMGRSCAVRFCEDDLVRARAAVREWRAEQPEGTAAQLVDEVGARFHPDWAPVLHPSRSLLLSGSCRT